MIQFERVSATLRGHLIRKFREKRYNSLDELLMSHPNQRLIAAMLSGECENVKDLAERLDVGVRTAERWRRELVLDVGRLGYSRSIGWRWQQQLRRRVGEALWPQGRAKRKKSSNRKRRSRLDRRIPIIVHPVKIMANKGKAHKHAVSLTSDPWADNEEQHSK